MAKLTIDFMFPLLTYDKSIFLFNNKPLLANKVLADNLYTNAGGKGSGVFLVWINDLYKTGKIEVSEEELVLLETFINESNFTLMASEGLKDAIAKAKESDNTVMDKAV